MKFPKDFLWGTAISAFQTEMGSSDESISKKSDWYVWVHDKNNIDEGVVSGDFPDDGDGFWDLYKEDVKNAKWMGNNAFRLSLDWARIFPDPTFEIEYDVEYENDNIVDVKISKKHLKDLKAIADEIALKRYIEIFKYIKKSGMKVLLTLYHWPLPIWLHDPIECHRDINSCNRRGWLDDKTIIEFAKYAFFSSHEFSKYVDIWETINEPEVIALQGYVLGPISGFPPALMDIEKGIRVKKNLVLAHSVAYRNIKRNDPMKKVGVGTAPQYFQPYRDDKESKNFVKYFSYVNNEWYLNAVNFGYFDMNLDGIFDLRIEKISPPDYIGIDYYQRLKMSYREIEGLPYLLNAEVEPCENCSDFMWDIYPPGIRIVANNIFEKYRKEMYILENGIADSSDSKRPQFIIDHIKEMEYAINDDKIPIKGYFHWSLIDNYEWAKGFSMRFGLFGVDYKTKKRYKRESAEIYRKICLGEI